MRERDLREREELSVLLDRAACDSQSVLRQSALRSLVATAPDHMQVLRVLLDRAASDADSQVRHQVAVQELTAVAASDSEVRAALADCVSGAGPGKSERPPFSP